MRREMERADLAFPRFVVTLHESVVRVVLLRPSRGAADIPGVAAQAVLGRRGLSAFISSTTADLPEHRDYVCEVCVRLGIAPLFWEHLQAQNVYRSQLDLVNEADIFIGVYGQKYGEVTGRGETAFVEKEYARARERDIPMLLFIMGDEHPVTREMVEQNRTARANLAAFKAWLRQMHSVEYFTSPADLRDSVAASIQLLLQTFDSKPVGANIDRPLAVPTPPALYAEPPYIAEHQFFGREAQLAELDAWADAGNPASVAVVQGIGGSGKSMLCWNWATSRAAQIRNDWAGCFWYSFHQEGSGIADFCARAVAYMSSQPLSPNLSARRDLQSELLRHLRSKSWLLVVDGAERMLVAYCVKTSSVPDETIANSNPRAALNPAVDHFFRSLVSAGPSKCW